LAQLQAKVHSVPTDWFEPLREDFLKSCNPAQAAIHAKCPPYATCWEVPFTGYDSGVPIMGKSDPKAEPKLVDIAKKTLEQLIESGVYEKLMLCEEFYPTHPAARRHVTLTYDFKPDNILVDMLAGKVNIIDYDLTYAGPAVHDFHLLYGLCLGAPYTDFEYRETWIREYLIASNFPSTPEDVREFMFDCEVSMISGLLGLFTLANPFQIPLLRGIPHMTSARVISSGPDDSPTGLELVDLVAAAVRKIRTDEVLYDQCLKEGLVKTIYAHEGFGSQVFFDWLQFAKDTYLLGLLGVGKIPPIIKPVGFVEDDA
jgi:hypothetical protein